MDVRESTIVEMIGRLADEDARGLLRALLEDQVFPVVAPKCRQYLIQQIGNHVHRLVNGLPGEAPIPDVESMDLPELADWCNGSALLHGVMAITGEDGPHTGIEGLADAMVGVMLLHCAGLFESMADTGLSLIELPADEHQSQDG